MTNVPARLNGKQYRFYRDMLLNNLSDAQVNHVCLVSGFRISADLPAQRRIEILLDRALGEQGNDLRGLLVVLANAAYETLPNPVGIILYNAISLNPGGSFEGIDVNTSNSLHQYIQRVLLDKYRTYDKMRQFISRQFGGMNLNNITGSTNLTTVVFEIVNWAASHIKIYNLVYAIENDVPPELM